MVSLHPINLMVISIHWKSWKQLGGTNQWQLIVKRFGEIQIPEEIQTSSSSQNVKQISERWFLRPLIAQEEAIELEWLTEVRFVASTVIRWGPLLLLNARSQGNSRILLMMSVQKKKIRKRLT